MTRRALTLLPLAALLALAPGCKTARSVGHFGERAFYHVRDHYRIRYRPDDQRLLPPDWRLINYRLDDEGHPTVASEAGAFWTGYSIEYRRRSRQVRAERIDLRYQHEGTPAMIWSRTVPTSESWADAPLETMLRDAVRGLDSDAPAGLDLVGQPLAQGHPTSTRMLEEGEAVVDGLPARWATFDLENRDTGAVDRFTVVLMHPGHNRWRYHRLGFPMLLIFGFVSRPATHERFRPVFESFVSRVDIAPNG